MPATHDDPLHDMGIRPDGGLVTAWMTVGEARAALVGAGQRALPVIGHDGLIGLITIEALSGTDDDAHPDPDDPVLSVMDWHLVQVSPAAEARQVVGTFTDAGWRWLRTRGHEAESPDVAGAGAPGAADPHPQRAPRRRPLWWMG